MDRNFEQQRSRYLTALVCLLFLFCLRVVGQLLVAFFHVPFLPTMEAWFSGVLSYPLLVVAQILIIFFYGKICLSLWNRKGYFFRPNKSLASWLILIGSLYFGIMVIRYSIQMFMYPHERWFGGSLPIFFHLVLSSFLITLGNYHRVTSSALEKGKNGKRPLSPLIMRRVFAAGSFMGIIVWMSIQLSTYAVAKVMKLRPAEFAVRVENNASFTTSDGIKLVADIFHPAHIEKTPTILVRIPFSKTTRNSLLEGLLGKLWAERGYTVVIQGTRGRFKSGGTMYPLVYERKDGKETLDWIAKQPWFNGKLGTWGGSSFGYTQWCISDLKNPAVSCFDIYEASSDFRSMFYPGEAFALTSALSWAGESYGEKDRADWFAAPEIVKAASGLPMIDADKRLVGKEISFFRDWALHGSRDSYWQDIDGLNRNQTLNAPSLLMAGWFDPFLSTQLNDYVQIQKSASNDVARRSCLIIGPWRHAEGVKMPPLGHEEEFRLKSFAVSLPFFDTNLEPIGARPLVRPPVEIYVMGRNQWRAEEEWPLARTRYTSLFLTGTGKANAFHAGGGLSFASPTKQEEPDYFQYDPANPVPSHGGSTLGPAGGSELQNEVEGREDVLNFTSPPLEADIEVTGSVKLLLNVSTTAPSTDFTAKLVDVDAYGRAYNVCDGILRRQHISPGDSEEISIDLGATSMVFLKGHRLRLEISSSNFPRFNCNLNTGKSNALSVEHVIAKQTVRHGAAFLSRLILPIIPNDSEVGNKSAKHEPKSSEQQLSGVNS
jgi:putative CocE/NonD family hydrolase